MSECRQIRSALAVYRELRADERARVGAHLATCPACAVTLARYQQQDRALAALPRLAPVTRPAELLARATASRHTPRRWAYALALVGVLLVSSLGATARVSAEALPGQPLYAVKRAMELVRQTITWREQSRADLAQELAERRRIEARQVQQQRLSAELAFEGRVQAAEAGLWLVEGLPVTVMPAMWAGEAPLGQMVRVRAQAAQGQLTALELRLHQAAAYPSPAYPGPAYPAPVGVGPAYPEPAPPGPALQAPPWAPPAKLSPYTAPHPGSEAAPYPSPTMTPGSATPLSSAPGPASDSVAPANPYPGPTSGHPAPTPEASSASPDVGSNGQSGAGGAQQGGSSPSGGGSNSGSSGSGGSKR